MGYAAAAGQAESQKDKKRPDGPRNFHKTIPRVLINLSCPSVQVVDRLRRNFPLSPSDLVTIPGREMRRESGR